MRRIPIPFTQRLTDFLRGPVVLLVWLGAVGGASWMLLQRPDPLTHVVWVPPVLAEVTAPSDGRIGLLSVRPSQLVRRGDVLGRLDDTTLIARLATEVARIEELRARVSAAEAAAANDLRRALQNLRLERADELRRWAGDLPRYQRDEANLALEVLALEVQVALDVAEIERIVVRRRRADGLAGGDAGPVAEAEDLALLQAKVEVDLETTQLLLARARIERDAATARLDTFVAQRPLTGVQLDVPLDALAGIRAAVEVQLLAVAEIRTALIGLQLIAPLNGRVHKLYFTDGQHVRAADPIMRIVSEGADEAVLFLDSATSDLDLIGRPVELRRPGRDGVSFRSTVRALAPHIELMPERLWLAPDQPRWGRAANVPLGPGHRFVPGEVLGVRMLK